MYIRMLKPVTILTAMIVTLTLGMTTPMRTNMELGVQERWLLERMMFVLWALLMNLALVVSNGF